MSWRPLALQSSVDVFWKDCGVKLRVLLNIWVSQRMMDSGYVLSRTMELFLILTRLASGGEVLYQPTEIS
jgi:hypothetical protein